jgi:putative hydrolase of the HAD superfamily
VEVQACLFDMDGVIRHWSIDRADRAEDVAGLPRGVLPATAFGVPEFQEGVLGWVTFDDWCQATADALAARYGADAARVAVQTWRENRGDIDQEIVGLIRELREHVAVGLLSNAHDCLHQDLEVHQLTGVFDQIVCSATVHLAKPDAAIYRHAAQVMGVPTTACFFTDDLEPNVAAAQAVGMRAQQFTDIETLTRSLHQLGLRTRP